MKRTSIDRDWLFVRRGLQNYPQMMTAGAETVHLPHDFTIGTDVSAETPEVGGTGYYRGGIGTYTKYIDCAAEPDDQRYLVEIDGAYRNTEVTLNGNLICQQPNGYMPFHADLTPYLKPGQPNRLSISANNSAPYDSRWYNGSGLYRHVDLLSGPSVHLAPWSIFARTERVSGDGTAIVLADVTVENHTAKTVTEQVTLTLTEEGVGEPSAVATVPVTVPPLGRRAARLRLAVKQAALWDLENPRLYAATAALCNGETDSTLFGIRMITVDAADGLLLNGLSLKLKGGCVHHTNGLLGAVSLYDAEYRKFVIMKQAGFNAVRCAHNPPSRDMLEACDRLGLLVLDEAFDMWRMREGSLAGDYHQFFNSHWRADLERMITRDRNHPCIFMWSIGNEIGERNGLSGGFSLAAEIADNARQLDSTRPITSAIPVPFNGLDDDGMDKMMQSWSEMLKKGLPAGGLQNLGNPFVDQAWGDMTAPFAAPLDVVGYNYLDERYEKDGAAFPHRVICGLESYPSNIDIIWDKVEQLPFVIGDFTWTAVDYIGEAGLGQAAYVTAEEAKKARPFQGAPVHFPWRTAFCGDFDLIGQPRPQLHYRQIVWGSEKTYLQARVPANMQKVEVLSRWGWPEAYQAWDFAGWEGHPTKVDVYSRADEVELILNGSSLGRQPVGKANRFRTIFDVIYQPGTLTAVSYTGGREISRASLETVGLPAAIRLSADKLLIPADGQSLVHVLAELVDEQGRLVQLDDRLATASLEGAAQLMAFGNGRPITTENYTDGRFTSYLGRWVAILRTGCEVGEAHLTVTAEGLKPVSLTIQIK